MRAPGLLASAAIGAVAFGGAAAAQSVAETVPIQATFQGDAPAACRLSSPTAPTADNVEVGALSPGSVDITISQMVGDDAAPIGAMVVLVLPAVCNQAHTLSLTSVNRGLLGDSVQPAGGPFRSLLPYSVTLSWAGGEQVLLTSDQDLSLALGNAAAGIITVTIQVPPGGLPLAAGSYTDELVLELGATG